MNATPRVTIGLPVRNGGRFLREAMSSLQDQTFSDLEIVISDNASTDDTEQICRDLGTSDPRIRYFRQPRNIGGPANWNFVFHQGRGRYFKWASANDVCRPTLVEECHAMLEEDPSVVLCYPRTRFIDADGQLQDLYDRDIELMQPDPAERFRRLILRGGLNNAHQGLIRTSALRKTYLERNYEHGDLPLMAELALLGKWALLPEPLFQRRMAEDTHMVDVTPEQRRELFYSQTPTPYLAFLRHFLGYCGVVLRSSAPASKKLDLYGTLARLLYWNGGRALEDLKHLLRWSLRIE